MKVTSLVALAALIGAAQPMAAEAKDKVFNEPNKYFRGYSH
jgi:hypothetical protein